MDRKGQNAVGEGGRGEGVSERHKSSGGNGFVRVT